MLLISGRKIEFRIHFCSSEEMQQQRRQQLWNFRFLYFFFVLLALITSNIIIKSGSAKAVGSKKIGRILHLTDFHVDVNYDTETGLISAFCHSSNKSPGQIADGRPAGKFGDRHCDAPKVGANTKVKSICCCHSHLFSCCWNTCYRRQNEWCRIRT